MSRARDKKLVNLSIAYYEMLELPGVICCKLLGLKVVVHLRNFLFQLLNQNNDKSYDA